MSLDDATIYAAMKIGTPEEVRRFLDEHGADGLAALNRTFAVSWLLDHGSGKTAAENATRREALQLLLDSGLVELGRLGGVLVWTSEYYDEEEGLRLYQTLLPRFTTEQQAQVIQRMGLVLRRPHVTELFKANPPPAPICRRALFMELEQGGRSELVRTLPYTCPTEYLLPHAGDLAGPDLDAPYGTLKLRPLERAALWYPKVAMALLDAGADPKIALRDVLSFRLPGNLESNKAELEIDAGADILTITKAVRAALFALRKQYVKHGWSEAAVSARVAEYDELLVRLGGSAETSPKKKTKSRAKAAKDIPSSPSARWFRELCTAAGLSPAKTDKALEARVEADASEWQKLCALIQACSDLEPFLEARGGSLRMLMEGGTGNADEVEEHLDEECLALLQAGELLAVEDADIWVLSNDVVSRLHPEGASRVGSVPDLIQWAIART